MHLSELRIRNFRACLDTSIHLKRDLTVLVGENNGGKTTVLDALRLLTTPSDPRRKRYPELRDVYRDHPDQPVRLDARFEDLSPTQKGWFITALESPTKATARLGYEWAPPPPGVRRSRATLTVGPRSSPDPEPTTREVVRHVHLPALRDATRDLASSAPGRIEFLLRHLMGESGKEKEKLLIQQAREAFGGLMAKSETLRLASQRVADEFNPLTDGFHPHKARLEFADATLLGLARDLRFRLSQNGVDLADLVETGLGYANLLYLASVLVELAAAKDAELTLLLVEEPEAHLHPQLQAVTLELLRTRARESQDRDTTRGQRAGRIQVIVTTHSPNLASAVPCDHIVVMRSRPGAELGQQSRHEDPSAEAKTLPATPGASPDGEGTPSATSIAKTCSATSQAVAISRLDVDSRLRRKVDRYLDVTRSGLLFSRRVLLVEGLAEALLMPVFARQLFPPGSSELNRFLATAVVAIDGVDFEPFVRLLLCPEEAGGPTIAELVVAVTDDDAVMDDPEDAEAEDGESEGGPTDDTDGGGRAAEHDNGGRRRVRALKAIAKQYGVDDRLDALVTTVTFEHALVEHCEENQDRLAMIASACAKMNKSSGWVERRRKRFISKVQNKPTPRDRASAFMTEFVAKKSFRKGDFAQLLAAELEPPDEPKKSFGVPSPFADALRRLVASP